MPPPEAQTQLIKVACPACALHIELPQAGYGENITCPHCAMVFGAVDKIPSGVPPPAPTPIPKWSLPQSESDRLSQLAGTLTAWGIFCFVLTLIALFVSGFMFANDIPGFGASVIIAGSFLGIAVCLLFFAQLLHIRAALTKR